MSRIATARKLARTCNRCHKLKRQPNADCTGTGVVHPRGFDAVAVATRIVNDIPQPASVEAAACDYCNGKPAAPCGHAVGRNVLVASPPVEASKPKKRTKKVQKEKQATVVEAEAAVKKLDEEFPEVKKAVSKSQAKREAVQKEAKSKKRTKKAAPAAEEA